jgi:hypothetical protein
MAVSGLPEPCTTHARNIAKLALDMMDRSKSVLLDRRPVVTTNQNKNLVAVEMYFILFRGSQSGFTPVKLLPE